MKILITGASGFVGKALIPLLVKDHSLKCAVHADTRDYSKQNPKIDFISLLLEELPEKNRFASLFNGVEVVIHLAGLAHVPVQGKPGLEKYCMKINYEAVNELALHAAEQGVRRFVFLSSANVHGKSEGERRLRKVQDPLCPYDSYTHSKALAEKALVQIQESTGMEVVVLRSPLIYGPEVKGNFRKLLGLVHRKIPLPFAGIQNLRSYVAIENLTSALVQCATHKNAANRIFLVSDGPGISTSRMIEDIALSMGKRPWMVYVPGSLMRSVLTFAGKSMIYDRLWLNSWVDSSEICQALGWQPVISWKQAIENTVKWYVSLKSDQEIG